MVSKKSNFYLTREELIREIILSKKKFRESNVPRTPAECFTPNLTQYLQLMVNRYANKGQWRGYSYIDDMKSDALLTLCQNAFKYNEEKYDNPFGYYTQIIKYCFITFLEKEEIIRDIKDSLWESIGMTPSYARQLKNEMLREVGDTSNKGLKALKKDADLMGEKINIIGSIIARVNRLREPDITIDLEIADSLDPDSEEEHLHVHPYTGDLEAVLNLFDGVVNFTLAEGVDIGGTLCIVLSLDNKATNSKIIRVLPDTTDISVTLALCSIGLTIRRDLMVKRLREISGFNLSPRFPVGEAAPAEALDVEQTDYTAPEPANKRRRRKTTT
jgi:hypothetical protein